MDLLLPVAPGGLDGRGFYGPRHWRDIHRSDPTELTQIDPEPLDLEELKGHLRVSADSTDEDGQISRLLTAARRQVESDLNMTLPRRTLQMVFDQFAIERWMPLPAPPLVSVDSVKSYDTLTGAESTFSSANYLVDTDSRPGRIVLVTGAVWPTGVRAHLGGKVTWTAGYASVPDRWVQAILLLVGHWFENPQAVTSGRDVPMEYPLGYEALIGDRLVSVG